MTDDEKSWARPGMTVEIVDVEIPADRYPVVELMYYDDLGQPLDRAGIETPGTISFSFVFAWYDGALNQYTAYTVRPAGDYEQATSDSGGSWEDVTIGHSFYTFGTQLPEGYDMTKTHTMYTYATRNTEEHPRQDLLLGSHLRLPSRRCRGDRDQWGSMLESTCNSCHHDLALHGSRRRALKGCMMCHSPQSTDPESGNTVNMKEMAHKIHMGANLPSVQAGIPLPDHRLSRFGSRLLRGHLSRRTSATARPATGMTLPRAIRYMTAPTRPPAAVATTTSTGRPAKAIRCRSSTMSLCANCHLPEGEHEFDISVIGCAHHPDQVDPAGRSEHGHHRRHQCRAWRDADGVLHAQERRRFDGRRRSPVCAPSLSGPPVRRVRPSITRSTSPRTLATRRPRVTSTWRPLKRRSPRTRPAPGPSPPMSAAPASLTTDQIEGLDVTEGAFNPIFYATVTDAEVDGRRRSCRWRSATPATTRSRSTAGSDSTSRNASSATARTTTTTRSGPKKKDRRSRSTCAG